MKITRQKLRQLIKESFKEKWEQRISQEPTAWNSELRAYIDMIRAGEYEAAAIGMLDYPEIAYQLPLNRRNRREFEPFFDFILRRPEFKNLDQAIYEGLSVGEQKLHKGKRDINQLLDNYQRRVPDLYVELYSAEFSAYTTYNWNVFSSDIEALKKISDDAHPLGISTLQPRVMIRRSPDVRIQDPIEEYIFDSWPERYKDIRRHISGKSYITLEAVYYGERSNPPY